MKRYLIFAAVGPFIGGFPDAGRHHLRIRLLGPDQRRGSGKAVRGVRQYAAIRLSVRRRAGTDDRRGGRHSVPRQADWLGNTAADRRRDRLRRGATDLRLPEIGCERRSVHSLRPAGPGPRDGCFLARA